MVENRSGAGGNVGAASVAKAAPDGHTLLFATTSVVNNRFMYKSVAFDADRDFVPIVLISKTPIVLVASQATGLKRLDALIAHAKANPGKLNIGSPGHGTAAHITAELLQRLAGFKLTHVPYRGSAPMIADLLGNQIDVVVRFVADANSAAQGRQVCGHRADQLGALRRAARPSDRGGERISGLRGDLVERAAGARRNAARRGPQAQRSGQRLPHRATRASRTSPSSTCRRAAAAPRISKAFMASEVAKWGPIFKAANITME